MKEKRTGRVTGVVGRLWNDLHGLAKAAVGRMLKMAERAGGDLTDFHERQLVHALFRELEKRHSNLWAAFEYGYFVSEVEWLIGKADICAHSDGGYGWIEVKSTGLNPSGRDNSALGIWIEDAMKLRQVRGQPHTQSGWVWLFLVETWQKELATLGRGAPWTARQAAGLVAQRIGNTTTTTGRLPRVLSDLHAFAVGEGTDALVSVMPQLRRAERNAWEGGAEYSALLVTVDFSPAAIAGSGLP